MNNWKTYRLDECCRIVGGATPLTTERNYWGGDLLWATPKDLNGLRSIYLSSTPRKITELGLKSCAAEILPAGSVLLSSRAPIGYVAINSVPMATNQGFKSLIPDLKLVDPKFLYFWLRSRKPYLESLGNGATFKEVSKAIVSRVEIQLPPLDYQNFAGSVMEKAEEIMENRRVYIEHVNRLIEAVFVEYFGNPHDASGRWPVARVDEAGIVQLGRQRAPKYQTGKFTKPYLRVANVFEDRIDLVDVLSMDFDDNDYRRYHLEYGDILLNEGQSTELVGRPAMWRSEIPNACYQNTLIRFQVDRDKAVPEYALALFLYYYRVGEFSRLSSKTSSVAHLGAARFAAMPFPLPPMELQIEFTKRLTTLKNLKVNASAHLRELELLFFSLQHRAFRGEL
ncbi:restriction endonuclease subunit S [Pseudomonas sp. SDT291_1_S447]